MDYEDDFPDLSDAIAEGLRAACDAELSRLRAVTVGEPGVGKTYLVDEEGFDSRTEDDKVAHLFIPGETVAVCGSTFSHEGCRNYERWPDRDGSPPIKPGERGCPACGAPLCAFCEMLSPPPPR